jgi:hypothetical protein
MRVDFNVPHYDQGSIQNAYTGGGAAGVGQHFTEHAITPGQDCIVIDGNAYRITAVRVICDSQQVYEDGGPPPGDPDYVKDYEEPDVQVQLWLEPIGIEECP